MKVRFLFASLLFSAAAHAEDEPPARVVVTALGPPNALLEERTTDGGVWSRVCALPCERVVTAAPWARHRIVVGPDDHPFTVRAPEGARANVAYSEGARGARSALVVSGSATAGIGLVLLAIGVGLGLAQRDPDPDRDRTEGSHAPAVLAASGFGAMATGGILALTGAVIGRSRVSVSF